jgi:hypothetical protein
MKPFMTRSAPTASKFRAAELTWVLLSLFEQGVRMRAHHWCLGELEPNDIVFDAGGIARTPTDTRAQRRAHLRRRERHLRQGHDRGCLLTGVPEGTVQRLVRAWGDEGAIEFVLGLADEVNIELSRTGIGPCDEWSSNETLEIVRYVLGRNITPKLPKTLTLTGAPAEKANAAKARVLFRTGRLRVALLPG